MTMVHDLAGFHTGPRKAQTEDNIVEAALQGDHQVLTDLTLHALCLVVIISKRFFKHTVDEFRLLLLTELKRILTHLSVGSLRLSVGFLVDAKKYGIQIKRSASFQHRSSINCHL